MQPLSLLTGHQRKTLYEKNSVMIDNVIAVLPQRLNAMNFTCEYNAALLVEEFHNETNWKLLTLVHDTCKAKQAKVR